MRDRRSPFEKEYRTEITRRLWAILRDWETRNGYGLEAKKRMKAELNNESRRIVDDLSLLAEVVPSPDSPHFDDAVTKALASLTSEEGKALTLDGVRQMARDARDECLSD
jgi:inorganic triphosphatase YgiF